MAFQQTPITMNLWPGLAPGESDADIGHARPATGDGVTRLTEITCPQMVIYPLPGDAARPGVIVFPGGGYEILAADLEGAEIAAWLNGLGFVAMVLHYRVPGRRDGAYQDAQRAVSLARAQAASWDLDPNRVGVLGFSAGGHLAARLAAGGGERTYAAADAVDEQSCLPNYALLIYPARLIDRQTGQPAADVQPHAGMPPMFLTQTLDDTHLCAPAYAEAVKAQGSAAACVTYAIGGHGYGLRLPKTAPAHDWAREAAQWLKSL